MGLLQTGLVKADPNPNIVTNLEFMSDAFTGHCTDTSCNELKLRSGVLDYD